MAKPLPGQLDLFAAPLTGRQAYAAADERPVRLNGSVPDHERARLSEQHHAILARLRQGPATNLELGQIAQRFTARLHELRKAGHDWRRETVRAGVYRYSLTTSHTGD